MSLKQCSVCEAMVEVSKAYCPNCGTPMDEEQKRDGSSEYDSLMKTQQVSKTTQFKLLEHFNLTSAFAPPKIDASESSEVENEGKSVQLNAQPALPVTYITPKQPDTAESQLRSEFNPVANKDASIDSNSKSDKKFYIVAGGIILFFLFLAIISVVFLGILYRDYLK